ncbi:hypothetical protein, partial [Paraburkholderia bannensis]|uniref:hypothetical protein n=1 Tax=Paraburkholderia bannensis TaxID=765414 RepID=UPI001C85DCD5
EAARAAPANVFCLRSSVSACGTAVACRYDRSHIPVGRHIRQMYDLHRAGPGHERPVEPVD